MEKRTMEELIAHLTENHPQDDFNYIIVFRSSEEEEFVRTKPGSIEEAIDAAKTIIIENDYHWRAPYYRNLLIVNDGVVKCYLELCWELK
jgi:hypothetical protein